MRRSLVLGGPGMYAKESCIDDVEIVLGSGVMADIRDYLLSDSSREYICHLLCGHTLIGRTLRLLVCYVVKPDQDDYISQRLTFLQLMPEFDHALRSACKADQMSLIDVHSHPFSSHHGGFSSTDDRDELEKFRYFERNLPASIFGSIVMSANSQEGRAFLPSGGTHYPKILPMRILCRDVPLTLDIEPPSLPPQIGDHFDRQVRAFGKEGQKSLSQLRVGVVGLGGIGASVAIGLARLGVRHFVLIDPDRVESTNLHRLAGSVESDVRNRRFKVRMVAHRIAQIDGASKVDVAKLDVFHPRAWQQLRGVDLIVASTDNHSSRMLLNSISQQYLVPLLSVGTLIRTDKGAFVDGYGEYYLSIPGARKPCLLCSQVINKIEAYFELGSDHNRRLAAAQGYVQGFDEPDPAVSHLNGVMANLALVEIHNLVSGFMPKKTHLSYTMSERMILDIDDGDSKCAVCSPSGGNFARGDRVDPVVSLFPGLNGD